MSAHLFATLLRTDLFLTQVYLEINLQVTTFFIQHLLLWLSEQITFFIPSSLLHQLPLIILPLFFIFLSNKLDKIGIISQILKVFNKFLKLELFITLAKLKVSLAFTCNLCFI
jgi:hypothetical protein